MPVRWTPQNDQLLLLKILETHKLVVDTKKVAEAWPQNDPDAIPTPRAIGERLGKIRTGSRASGANFSIALSKDPKNSPKTPRKRTASGTPKTPASKNKSSQKSVKARDQAPDYDAKLKLETENDDLDTPTAKRVRVKNEPSDEETMAIETDEFKTPSKRTRVAPATSRGMDPSYDPADDVHKEYESSASEFNPEEEAEEEEYEEVDMA